MTQEGLHIALDLEDAALAGQIRQDAERLEVTPNGLVKRLLEAVYADCGSCLRLLDQLEREEDDLDFCAALEELCQEARAREPGKFTLSDLNSLLRIAVVETASGYFRPDIRRARLGKMFNKRVRANGCPGVRRAKRFEPDGPLLFWSGAAVYERLKGEEETADAPAEGGL